MWNPVDITALVVAVAAGAVAVINALRARTAAASAVASAERARAAAASLSRLEPGPFGGPSVIGGDPLSSSEILRTITDGIDPTGGPSSAPPGKLGAGPWHEPGVEDDR
jgi:hypothetical protein